MFFWSGEGLSQHTLYGVQHIHIRIFTYALYVLPPRRRRPKLVLNETSIHYTYMEGIVGSFNKIKTSLGVKKNHQHLSTFLWLEVNFLVKSFPQCTLYIYILAQYFCKQLYVYVYMNEERKKERQKRNSSTVSYHRAEQRLRMSLHSRADLRMATLCKSVRKFWFCKLALTCVDLRVRLASGFTVHCLPCGWVRKHESK